jgi:hypothetical protein
VAELSRSSSAKAKQQAASQQATHDREGGGVERIGGRNDKECIPEDKGGNIDKVNRKNNYIILVLFEILFKFL